MKALLLLLTLFLIASNLYLIRVIRDEYGYPMIPKSAVIILILTFLIFIGLLNI
jgi:hypothetical protein